MKTKLSAWRSSLLIPIASAAILATSSAGFAAQPTMKTTGRTSQPIGHAVFCEQYDNECGQTRKSAAQKLTRSKWDELIEINAVVNSSIQQLTDEAIYNVVEHWTYPDRAGDCEDLVLLKRYMLIKRGWAASNLLITVVRQPNGEGHAVLTVRTDRGDFILDNLKERVKRWDQTEYRYLKRIARGHSGHWENINDSRRVITGSIN